MRFQMSDWQIYEDDEVIRFTNPQGFNYDFYDIPHVFTELNSLIQPGKFIHTKHSIVQHDVNGELIVLQPDPWLQDKFTVGDNLGTAASLMRVILSYLRSFFDEDTHRTLSKV
jgi:hypothetical protein